MNRELIERFNIRLAYKFDDVRVDYRSNLQKRPLVPEYRGLLNLDYATKYEKWKFDFTIQLTGEQNLFFTVNDESPAKSKSFYLMNAQVTRKFKTFEFYGGQDLHQWP